MAEVFAVLSGALSGVCLLIIALRKRLPLIGSLASHKLKTPIDTTDRRLALASAGFFVVCMIFLVISFR